jgi:hypothetical protein
MIEKEHNQRKAREKKNYKKTGGIIRQLNPLE